MEKSFRWFNWKSLLIFVILISIPIHVGINYYFWDFSSENFNNIVTPVTGIISTIFFFVTVWITIFQSKMVIRQHEIIESQQHKDTLEAEYIILEETRKVNFSTLVLTQVGFVNGGLSDHFKKHYLKEEGIDKITVINLNNYIEFLDMEQGLVVFNSQYQDDLLDYQVNQLHLKPYFRTRSYYESLSILLAIGSAANSNYIALRDFVKKVQLSNMIQMHKLSFYSRIRANWLKDYLIYIDSIEGIEIPNLKGTIHPNLVNWIDLNKTSIGELKEDLKDIM